LLTTARASTLKVAKLVAEPAIEDEATGDYRRR
jgi:hypothetical protein